MSGAAGRGRRGRAGRSLRGALQRALGADRRHRSGGDPRPHVLLATRVFAPEPVAAAFREEALAHALADVGAQVRVLTTVDPASRTSRLGKRAVRISRFPVKRDRQGQVRGYLSYLSFDVPLAARILLAGRADAIVAEPPPTTGAVVMAAAALRRVPFAFYAADVWSDATDSVGGVPGPIRSAVRWAETTVWRRAARVLTISPGVDRRVQELSGARARTAMVGNGIDTAVFTDEGPDAGETGPYFVYAGTVSEWQGADVFVEAFIRVRERHPQARLLFFSEGSGRDHLASLIQERGAAGIELRAKIPPAEVARFLRGAVAGLSSITPGQGYEFALPTKIYAATACGTPVIHAGGGAAFERVRDAGLGWACEHDAAAVESAMAEALTGAGAPGRAHLREWTEANASLAACAALAAAEVLATIRR